MSCKLSQHSTGHHGTALYRTCCLLIPVELRLRIIYLLQPAQCHLDKAGIRGWRNNHLTLNVYKTNQLIAKFKRKGNSNAVHPGRRSGDGEGEGKSWCWLVNNEAVHKKIRNRLDFLRRLLQICCRESYLLIHHLLG